MKWLAGLKISLKSQKFFFFCCKDRTPTFNSDVLKQYKWRSDVIDIFYTYRLVQNKKFLELFLSKISSVEKFYV